eukprot:COSAG02_NODE_1054_length_14930_cov_2157.848291_19_plen_38_part_00
MHARGARPVAGALWWISDGLDMAVRRGSEVLCLTGEA